MSLVATAIIATAAYADEHSGVAVQPLPYKTGATMTAAMQAGVSPDKALAILKEGNRRFATGKHVGRDYRKQVGVTSHGQFPFATILGCIDSRVPPEVVFDTGIGDIFDARVAGNTVDEDIIGSLEYGSKVAGARLIVVLGHTQCGAVKGACDGVKLGNLSTLLAKIQPAVDATKTTGERNSSNHKFVDDVAEMNVEYVIKTMREKSPVLKELEDAGKIRIVGAVYDTTTGKVHWQ